MATPCKACKDRKKERKLRRELAKLKKENKQSEEFNEKTRREIAMLKKMLMFLTSIWRPEPGPAPGPGMRGHPGRGGTQEEEGGLRKKDKTKLWISLLRRNKKKSSYVTL